MGGLGCILGPLAAGVVFEIGGPGAPFLAGGLLVALATLLLLPALPVASPLKQADAAAIPPEQVASVAGERQLE